MILPTRKAVWALAGLAMVATVATILGRSPVEIATAGGTALVVALAWTVADLWLSRRAWRRAPLRIERTLPKAFALGAPKVLGLGILNPGSQAVRATLFDEVDSGFSFEGLPQSVTVPAGGRVDIRYTVTPRRRGMATFGVTQVRWRTRGGSLDVLESLGQAQELHVYPNFAAVARYAWLAGDRRLAQIGIKAYARRGLGTDFRQLAEYRRGESVRHIDWKASVRHARPIVREFQDDRDQCVIFLLDCGRRMRADEGDPGAGGSHFDHALNALMLLGYVALKEGDEVGALTFGNPPGRERHFAPSKGLASLNGLMNRLHDVQPTPTHSDYLAAAQHLLTTHRKRAMVIVLTNFRDEDATELRPALKLLRMQHLVLVASLRERVLGQIERAPMLHPQDAANVATAHLFEQSRRDAFARLLGNDALSVDVEPAQLAVALVNRYHAVKRAGML